MWFEGVGVGVEMGAGVGVGVGAGARVHGRFLVLGSVPWFWPLAPGPGASRLRFEI